jgi:hypothetical protein
MSESETSSTVSFDNIAVCDEIGQLIEKCEELHQEINLSFQNLENIQVLLQNSNNIFVNYNGSQVDLYEILENIHSSIITEIKEGSEINFGERILKELENMTFYKN